MARYRIICTRQEPASAAPSHQHSWLSGSGLNPVTTRTFGRWLRSWKPCVAVKRSTPRASSGKIAEVEQYYCSYCRRTYIRSYRDAVTDNNLDNLPRCA